MANTKRGEVEVELNGEPITLRPDFNALCEIEGRSGLTISELGARALTGRLGLFHVALIIWAGHRAVVGIEKSPSLQEIGGWVVEAGYSSFLVADDSGTETAVGLTKFLEYALGWTGDEDDEKKSGEAAETPPATG